ncbi:MAG: Acetyltransferase family protein [Francisellaceae bacterium]|nr:Acetyltransferase family protein [Francisellaceae bacterium]
MKFKQNYPELHFEWNSASLKDWKAIKKLFITGYIHSYKDKPFDELAIEQALIKKSQRIVNESIKNLKDNTDSKLISKILNILKPFFTYNWDKNFLLNLDFQNFTTDIQLKILYQYKAYLIKLLALKMFFEREFNHEKKLFYQKNLLKKYVF